MNSSIYNIKVCLETAPNLLKDLLSHIPGNIYKVKKKSNKWSIHVHSCHIVVVQPLMIERMRQFLKEETPVFQPYFPDEIMTEEFLLSLDIHETIALFFSYRKELLSMIDELNDQSLKRQAFHPEYELYTPLIMLRHMMMHDQLHMYQIEDIWLKKEEYLSNTDKYNLVIN